MWVWGAGRGRNEGAPRGSLSFVPCAHLECNRLVRLFASPSTLPRRAHHRLCRTCSKNALTGTLDPGLGGGGGWPLMGFLRISKNRLRGPLPRALPPWPASRPSCSSESWGTGQRGGQGRGERVGAVTVFVGAYAHLRARRMHTCALTKLRVRCACTHPSVTQCQRADRHAARFLGRRIQGCRTAGPQCQPPGWHGPGGVGRAGGVALGRPEPDAQPRPPRLPPQGHGGGGASSRGMRGHPPHVLGLPVTALFAFSQSSPHA